jgi:hypothetical protein
MVAENQRRQCPLSKEVIAYANLANAHWRHAAGRTPRDDPVSFMPGGVASPYP